MFLRPPCRMAAALVAAGAGLAAAAPPPARPNLLVFLADDLGAHDLGCTGSRGYSTPAIDGLAAAGMRFTRGYAASTVCSPTRAALVTGRHPARVRITNFIAGNRRGCLLPADYLHALPEAEVTVPELLQQAGYATGCFGKWHLGPPEGVRRHGFDTVGSNSTEPGRGPPHDPLHARAIAAQAASFIETSAGRPWFCYVPMHSVHAPQTARAELVAAEEQRLAGLPPHEGPREVPEGDRTARAVQDLPVYAAMIRELDETVATVLEAVERTRQSAGTVVVFTSDNGGLATAEGSPTSNLPLRAGKGYLYEGGIRVPLVIRWPGVVAAGTTCDVPVTTLDVAATLLDAGGVRPPARKKIVEHFEDGRVELFDLAVDPGERHDLAAERPERARELQRRLAAWRQSVAAAMPTPNPQPVDPYGRERLPPKK